MLRRFWRYLFRLALLVAAVAALIYGGAYSLPDAARAERHISIAAPPDKVWPLIAEVRNYPAWQAWDIMAPGIAFEFSGPPMGKDQVMSWMSASPVLGDGKATVLTADSNAITLVVESTTLASATMVLSVAPVEGGSGVTWTISTPNTSLRERFERYFTFERDMTPAMVRSLANLKSRAEQTP